MPGTGHLQPRFQRVPCRWCLLWALACYQQGHQPGAAARAAACKLHHPLTQAITTATKTASCCLRTPPLPQGDGGVIKTIIKKGEGWETPEKGGDVSHTGIVGASNY